MSRNTIKESDIKRLIGRVINEQDFQLQGDEPATKSDLYNAVNYIIKTLRDEISVGSYGDFIKEGSLNEWAPNEVLPGVAMQDNAKHDFDTGNQGPITNVSQAMITGCMHHLQNIPTGNNAWIQGIVTMTMGKPCSFLATKYQQLYNDLQTITPGTNTYARKQARLFFIECLWAQCTG